MVAAARLTLACASFVLRLVEGSSDGIAEKPWQTGLQGTTFWDCNGAHCDAKILKPYVEMDYIYAPHYAPTDPNGFGGGEYGEHLWLTGAASDALTDVMGEEAACCGEGAGCGHCLLVRNPTAAHFNWTAVVMKKSRCPPESKGCQAGMRHMDFAVPGYEFITESTDNVCGSKHRKDTYLTLSESGACILKGAAALSGLCCEALPNSTAEQRRLKQGCEVFSEWGWTNGAPALEFKTVPCPKAWVARVSEAFSSSGVRTLDRPSYRLYFLFFAIVIIMCIAIGVINKFMDRRAAKRKYAEMELRKQTAAKKAKKRRKTLGASTDSGASTQSSESEASSLE